MNLHFSISISMAKLSYPVHGYQNSIDNITNEYFPFPFPSLLPSPFSCSSLFSSLLLLLPHSHWKCTFRVIWPATKHLQNVIRQTTRCSLTNHSTNTFTHTQSQIHLAAILRSVIGQVLRHLVSFDGFSIILGLALPAWQLVQSSH